MTRQKPSTLPLNFYHRPIAVGALMLSLAVSLPGTATEFSEEQQAQVNLALEIVNSYRQLRSSCTDVEDTAREMCYYRLKVGLWDYKEARKTLSQFGIRVHSATQVAER